MQASNENVGKNEQRSNGKNPLTAIFIPCCKTKKQIERYKGKGVAITKRDLSNNTWQNLLNGRQAMSSCIGPNDHVLKVPAINLYDGHFYQEVGNEWDNILEMIENGWLRIFVISAGYGIIDIREPINNYDAEMIKYGKGICKRGAIQWKNYELEAIIADLLKKLRPDRIFGFFTGKPEYSGGGPKDRYFFSECVCRAISSGIKPVCAGCFYRKSGRGAAAVIRCLAKAFINHSKRQFDCSYGPQLIRNPLRCNKIEVSYNRIV